MCISVFFLWLLSVPLFVHAVPEPRGYLLNCGAAEAVEQDGLKYIPDQGYTSVGEVTTVEQSADLLPILSTLRYFPDPLARKYCYHFQVTIGRKFLIRTTYYYGGFDGGNEPPVFDQIVDGTMWSTVNTTEDYAAGRSSYYEIIITTHSKMLSVCLARNGHTPHSSSPFISALEVQHLDDSLYNATDFGKFALHTVARNSFGEGVDIIRYPDDEFNRFWHPFMDNNPTVDSHSNITTQGFWNCPPSKAFKTAITTSRGKTLTIKWPPFMLLSGQYYVALYFQDNRTPSPYSWRVFSVTVDGEKFYTDLNLTSHGVTVYGSQWLLSGGTEIVLTPRGDMPVGPLISAGEILQILPLGGRTLIKDGVVMEELARSFDNPPPDWSGDPCLPKLNSWTGVACSEGKNIRVVSINLTSFGVSGSLSPAIGRLTALTSLLLGDNQLSGTIPDLSSLKALQTLHLDGNLFGGPIPQSIGQLPRLREIFLQNNNLNGSIPESLTSKKDTNLQVSPGNYNLAS